MTAPDTLDRVVVTRGMVGICHMQVCAEKDATDEEILEVCNRKNPSGTTLGWTTVIRHEEQETWLTGDPVEPVACDDDPDRLHRLVRC